LSGLDESKLLSNIWENLQKIDVNAQLLERYSPEAIGEGRIRWLSAVYDINEGPLYVGSIKVSGRSFTQIQIFSRMVPSDVGAFRWYDVHFCVLGGVKGKSKELTTTIKGEDKVDKLTWVGASLANRLNGDAGLKEVLVKFGLWRFYGDLHPTSSVRVCPDEKYGCARIVFRMSRKTSKDHEMLVSKTLESLEVAERIAQHIHTVVD